MERVKIKSLARVKAGKEITKKERKQGLTPAVIYGRGFNLCVNLPHAAMKALKSIHFSESMMIEMDVDGYEKNPVLVLVKDVQYNPLTEEVIHIDFMRVSMEEKIRVHVTVALKGDCAGVKEGGVLEQLLWHITIEALPVDIPAKIEIDVSSLGIGDSIHVKDLDIPAKVRVLEPGDETVVTVVAKHEEPEEEEVTPGLEEAKEPEVIKEKEQAKDKEKEES